jgi:hypothetical protein
LKYPIVEIGYTANHVPYTPVQSLTEIRDAISTQPNVILIINIEVERCHETAVYLPVVTDDTILVSTSDRPVGEDSFKLIEESGTLALEKWPAEA